MPVLRLQKTSSLEKRCNVYCHLFAREYNSASNHRRIHHITGTLITKGNYTFKRSWFQVSKKHIASDGRHAFFDNYLTCIQCTSTLDQPHKKFSIKRNSAAKIEDALVMEGCPETINLPYKGYRASVFAVTKDHFLLRIDLETGEIMEEVYIDCPSFVYNALNKKIQWNVVDESFTIISKKGLLPGYVPPGAGGETKMIELTVMSCMPLGFKCCFAVTKKTFGKDVVEAAVFLNILMVMHSTDYVRMYSLEKIMEENCIHQQKLYEKCGDESYYGVFPTSLTHNINLDVKPDCLFEVRCQNRDVMLTMPPCYYVMWPHGDPGGYCCYSFETGKMVKGGRLEAEENAIEERVSLHADDSGRIIHMKTSELRVLKLKAGRFDEEKCLMEDFAINFAEERQSELPDLKVSLSGRIIKQRVMQDCGQLAERTVQTMVYDEDLDMMIVVSLTNPASDVDDNQSCTVVGFYDNWTGHLLRQFVLEDSAVETLEQSICFSQDTLTHTFKTTFGKFECHVYKLKPLHDMEDEFRLRGKMKSEKKRNSFGTQLRRQRSRRRISRSHR